MPETLKTQLETLEKDLPTVDTAHYVLLHRSRQGPVAYLLEKCEPPGEKAILRMDTVVRPEYQAKLRASRRNRLVSRTYRTRYKFEYKRPAYAVCLPADAACPEDSRWISIVGKMYERLRDHDAEAWELILGDLLDIRSAATSDGPCSKGRG